MKKIASIFVFTLFTLILYSCNQLNAGHNSIVIKFPESVSDSISSISQDVTANGGFKCASKVYGDYNRVQAKTYTSLEQLNGETFVFDDIPTGSTVNIIFELSVGNNVYYRGRIDSLLVTMTETFVNLDLYKASGEPEISDDDGNSDPSGSSGYNGPVPEGFVVLNPNHGVTFVMGNSDVFQKYVHNVTLTRAFFICDHEVTQAEYESVMGDNPSTFTSDPDGDEIQGNRPVDSVSSYAAMVYCNKKSIAEGLNPVYTIKNSKNPDDWGPIPTASDPDWYRPNIDFDCDGYRLPTEAEWEYAARGGRTGTKNADFDNSDNEDYEWSSSNSNDITHEVRKKKPNGYGLYDMGGNVKEWVNDLPADNLVFRVDSTDPCWLGTATTESNRLVKGYSYKSDMVIGTAITCTSSTGAFDTRNNSAYDESRPQIGFRVVRSIIPDLEKIEIITQPNKIKYLIGQTFSASGISVRATDKVGQIFDVTSKVKYSGFDSTALNDSLPVTVSYTKNGITKTATLALSIVETMGTGNFDYTSAKVGDIILADGSIASYTDFDRTTMKAAAVIFREASDTQPALGVGLVESPVSARWSVSGSEAYKTTVSYMKNDSLTDGSKGWNLMLSATNNDLTANPDYYSAWYFCKNYGTNNGLLTLNNKWYFPTVSEMKEFKNTFATVNSSLTKVGGTVLKNAYYKTCNQNSTQGYIDTINPSTGATSSCQKNDVSNYTVRAIRAFGKPKQWSVNSLSLQSKLVINEIEVAYTAEAAVLTETKLIPNTTYGTMFKTGRDITLSPYIIGKYEVTQKLFSTVMGYNPSLCNSSSSSYKPDSNSDIPNLPVDNVNWYEACAFCNELTKSLFGTATDQFVYYSDRAFSTVYTVDDALNQVNAYMKPGAKGYRLPTGAEWEYAARGGEYSTEEQYQYRYSGVDSNNTNSAWDSTLDRSVWYLFNLENGNTVQGAGTQLTSGSSGFSSKRVGRKSTNAAGIYDMSGNVNEWCYDKYQLTLENPVSIKDPLGPDDDSITSHEYRGGSWGMYAKDMQLYNRSSSSAGAKSVSMGFRICRYAD